MARDTLFNHPKFLRLIHLLLEPEPHVLGYLEYLWCVAYQSGEAVIGDELSVELAAKYPGARGKLCQALARGAAVKRLIDAAGTELHRFAEIERTIWRWFINPCDWTPLVDELLVAESSAVESDGAPDAAAPAVEAPATPVVEAALTN